MNDDFLPFLVALFFAVPQLAGAFALLALYWRGARNGRHYLSYLGEVALVVLPFALFLGAVNAVRSETHGYTASLPPGAPGGVLLVIASVLGWGISAALAATHPKTGRSDTLPKPGPRWSERDTSRPRTDGIQPAQDDVTERSPESE
jgi:hypothetical protein